MKKSLRLPIPLLRLERRRHHRRLRGEELVFAITFAGDLPLDNVVALGSEVENPGTEAKNMELADALNGRKPCARLQTIENDLLLGHFLSSK